MSKAVLITGFSNWGKTTLIRELFKGRKKFNKREPYHLDINTNYPEFIVVQHSNDDIQNEDRFIKSIMDKYDGIEPSDKNLLVAFCPTSKTGNDSKEILRKYPFKKFDEIIMICIVDRWNLHASLNMGWIVNYYKEFDNVIIKNIYTIHIHDEQDRLLHQKSEAIKIINEIFLPIDL